MKSNRAPVTSSWRKQVKTWPTQWDSLYLGICRMLDVKQRLTTMLEELEWENLNVAQWKHLSSIEALLKPFTLQTNVTSSKSSVFVVLVFL